MKHLVVTTLLVVAMCFGANLVRAPKVEAISFDEISNSNITPKSLPFCNPDPHLISPIPDLRSIAGSPGKNIVFAEDGQNIGVIYGRFSGNPVDIFDVYWAYSYDRGNSWFQFGPLNSYPSRRVYPGLDAEQDWPQANSLIHFVWTQSSYDSSACYYGNSLGGYGFRLPNSEDVIFPCVGVKDSFIIITGGGRIWRIVGGDTGRVFIPNAEPHFRFGSDGYMFFLWVWGDSSWPYYCESFNYGVTWTQPELIWQNSPPYPNMSDVHCYGHSFDCEVVNDTPVATMKLSSGNYDFGELWVYRPTGGTPGNWQFTGTCLVGGDSTAPQNIERYATVAKDDRGDIFVGYQANWITPIDTGFDCGAFVRPYNRDVWLDWGIVTHGRYAAATDQAMLEFAHNAPIVGTSPNDSAVIGLIWANAQNYPTSGNLYFEDTAITAIGITESNHPVINKTNLTVTPNPFRNSVRFIVSSQTGEAKLSIYDVTGKLVTSLKPPVTNTCFVWDGRKTDGSKVNAGVYFYYLSSDGYLNKGKVILTR